MSQIKTTLLKHQDKMIKGSYNHHFNHHINSINTEVSNIEEQALNYLNSNT